MILGLLVGGVLSGRSLIRAAELRSITTERDKFAMVIFTFRDKYFGLPGDLNNAYQFWGATCGTNTTTPSTGCNGDGDGMIEPKATNGENIKVWEHLSRAGLIEGTYDGTGTQTGASSEVTAPSVSNVPKSKFAQNYWDLTDMAGDGNTSTYINLAGYGATSVERLVLHLGAMVGADEGLGFTEGLTRGDAWSIDTKTDDGKANTGKTRGDATSDCLDFSTDYYNLTGTGGAGGDANTKDCMLHFILQ